MRNRLVLPQSDRSILDSIAAAVPGRRHMVYSKGAKVWRLTISVPGIGDVLAKRGIVPNKTKFGFWPPDIPEKYVCDYLRGFFDGDGHISVHPDIPHRCNVGFVCHLRPFLERVETEFRKRGCSDKPVWQDKRNFRLRYSSMDDVIKLFDLLYKDIEGCLRMESKQLSFQQAYLNMQAYDGRPTGEDHHNSTLTAEDVKEMRHLRTTNPSKWTYKKLSQRYNMSISGVFGICNHITW